MLEGVRYLMNDRLVEYNVPQYEEVPWQRDE